MTDTNTNVQNDDQTATPVATTDAPSQEETKVEDQAAVTTEPKAEEAKTE